MSQIRLAELVDGLGATDDAVIVESAERVNISNLSVAAAQIVLRHVETLGWARAAFDTEGTPWNIDDLTEAFAPFRVTFEKPQMADGSLLVLTNFGFATFLRVGHQAKNWRVARIGDTLHTRSRTFMSWEAQDTCTVGAVTKSPRALVRETAAQRLAPEDIRPWIAVDETYAFNDAASKTWADACVIANLNAVPDEIESNTGNLKFKGPPRLSLSRGDAAGGPFAHLGEETFRQLQQVVNWIYENEREAEVRHLLFSAELARSGGGFDDVFASLKRDCSAAFDGAKIAYQMSISDLGKDTLKALSDLKKSVTEDTSKVADATRQTVTAVASALAVGLGLLAARVASAASPWLIFGVMIIVALYVGAIVYSGYSFILLQRKLRVDWQPRLYRFLSDEDFTRMVKNPSGAAEKTFFWTAGVGVVAVVLLMIAFGFVAALVESPASKPPIAAGTGSAPASGQASGSTTPKASASPAKSVAPASAKATGATSVVAKSASSTVGIGASPTQNKPSTVTSAKENPASRQR